MKNRKVSIFVVSLLLLFVIIFFMDKDNVADVKESKSDISEDASPQDKDRQTENPKSIALVRAQETIPKEILQSEKAALLLSVISKETMEPIEGAEVEIETEPTFTSLVTDGEGFCELSGLEPGMLRVAARADGYAKQITFVNILPATANAAVLTLGPAGEVHVYTVDKDGNPVPDVLVELWPEFTNFHKNDKLDRLRTNSDGFGVFTNVSCGPRYLLLPKINDEGIFKYFKECSFTFEDTENPITKVTLVITGQNNINMNAISQNGSLRGRVIDPDNQPVPGLSLKLQVLDRQPYEPQQTDENGEFQYSELPNKRSWNLSLTVSGKGYKPIINYEVHPGTFVELKIFPSSSLRGRVVDVVTSQPIQSFALKVLSNSDVHINQNDDRSNGISMYSADGTFMLDTIYPEDETIIVADADGYSQKKISVDYDNLPEELLIPMTPKDPPLEGIIIDKNTGQPVAKAFVGVYTFTQREIEITPQWRDYLNASTPLRQFCSLSVFSGVEGKFKFDIEQKDAILLIYSNDYGLNLIIISQLTSIQSTNEKLVIKLRRASSLTIDNQFGNQDGLSLPKEYLRKRIDVPVVGYGMAFQDILYKDVTNKSSNTFQWNNLTEGEYVFWMTMQLTGKEKYGAESVSVGHLKTIVSGEAASINIPVPTGRISGRATLSGKPFKGRFRFNPQAEISHDYPTYGCLVLSNTEGVYTTPWIGQGTYTLTVYNADPENPQSPPAPPPPIEVTGDIRMDFSF